MLTLSLVLFLAGVPARATAPAGPCPWLDVTYLNDDTDRAWQRLRDGLRILHKPRATDDWLSELQRRARAAVTSREGRLLVTAALGSDERRVLCDAVTPLLLETNAASLDADLTLYLLDQLCGLDDADVRAVTEAALARQPSAETSRWLARVAELGLLAADHWRALLARDPHGTLVGFARGRWLRLGLGEADVLAVARALVGRGESIAAVLERTGLRREVLTALAPDFDPIQWLEFRRAEGFLGEAALRHAEEMPVPARRVPFARIERLLLDLLLDEGVPYPTFTRVRTIAGALWTRQRNEPLPALSYQPPARPSAGQLDRVEWALGPLVARPAEVWQDSQKYARAIEASLDAVRFARAADFVKGFTLSNHTHRHLPKNGAFLNPLAREDARAVADVYFRRLSEELPRFFALEPTVAQVRWLLETPNEFAALKLACEVDPRPRWRRDLCVRPGVFDTARLVRDLQDRALAWAMPRVKTLGEWELLLGARSPFDLGGEILRRERIAKHLSVAARVGPADLSWLDLPLVRKAGQVLYPLDELRRAEPWSTRDDEHLGPRALRHLIRSDQAGRQTLLTYLAARARAGSLLHVPPRRLARLRAIAFTHGFAFEELARDHAHVAIRVIPRPRP